MPARDPKTYHAGWRSRNRVKLRDKSRAYYSQSADSLRRQRAERKKRERLADIEWMNRR